MSFVDKLKSVFRSKAPSYKFYNAGELKVLAMKTRIYLQQYYKKCLQIIQASDTILFQRKDMSVDGYRILQEIGRHVIQVQSIKIYVEILKKIQAGSAAIIKTNGDIALLKTQINWFQCLLWYRKCKKLQGLDALHQFCFNFFKGVDVTCQINPKCQLFRLYHIMLYLNPDCVVPLKKIYPEITMYIKTKLDEGVLQQIFRYNHTQIKTWVNKDQNQFRQHYLSGSKSPIKRRKTITPNKEIHHFQLSKKYTINDNPGSKIQQPPKQPIKSEISSAEVPVVPKPGGSFMRRVMQSSSKIKNKNLCMDCGAQFQFDAKSDKNSNICQLCINKQSQSKCTQCGIGINLKKDQFATQSKLCKACQINQLMDQPQKINQFTCKDCHKKFNQPTNSCNQEEKHIFSEVCQGCFDTLYKKCANCQKNNHISLYQKNGGNFCLPCHEMLNRQCTHCHKKINQSEKLNSYSFGQPSLSQNQQLCQSCNYILNRKCSDCKKNINPETDTIFNAVSLNGMETNGKQIQQLCKQCYEFKKKEEDQKLRAQKQQIGQKQNIGYQDQQQSLRFIRESIVQKKKPAKKPYMVSIYARAEYVQNKNKI